MGRPYHKSNPYTTERVMGKAHELGFKLVIVGNHFYRLQFFVGDRVTGFGCQGTLKECFIYMQGWEERSKFLDATLPNA